MNTWIIVCTYTANETVFYQLRLCVESILREVPRKDYVRLLVVDDHSTYDYSKFRDHYKNDDRIDFLMLGDPLPSYYSKTGRGSEQKRPTSDGHGVALHKGILHAKERGAEHIWSLDSDTFILDGSCLAKASAVMQRRNEIRSVGDYEGGKPSFKDIIFFKEHCCLSNGDKRRPRCDEREGKTNAICALWSIKDYDYPFEHLRGKQLWTDAARFENLGQSATRVVLGLWSKGWATAYFPFFWHRYVMHFGYGSLIFTREETDRRGIGNAPDTRARYASRSSGNFYAGFLQLKCPTPDFHRYLHRLYKDRSFDDVSARFNRSLLVPPKGYK